MEIGKIKPKEITEEMQDSYLDYAMSVIVSRALPDVRDGLKPVHRRILYAMSEIGLNHTAKFRKSAAVVGEVMAKYHPHGDASIYEALVRMAQNFSLRYPLVNGQGNFGSIDGDNAAAMRYTECRLTQMGEELLADIEKETVDWQPNYDSTKQEPKFLPSKIPQLLLNGTTGIAVGMATSVPPHNLGELTDGLIHLIDRPKASVEDLLNFVKGPDFPTGGAIYNKKDVLAAYSTGRGPITTRGTVEILEKKAGQQFQIIVTEIPFLVNKSALIEHIADLVKDKRIEGIKNLRDESDREGMRIVIELKSDAAPQKVLNSLYKLTDLQKTFHLNMLALVEGIQPQVLSLKSILENFIKHRQEVVVKRSKFDLARAKERAHILEGMDKALDQIDAIIKAIKKSADKDEARQNLLKKFKFTEVQANAILEIKLQTLAGLERKKIEDELKEKKQFIKELTLLLADPKKILEAIKKELLELKGKYGDDRRTKVFASPIGEFKEEDLIPQEETVIILTHGGYIKRLKPSAYRMQKRGGKGTIGITTREEDAVEHFLSGYTHDNVLFFTTQGRVFQSHVYEIPEATRQARGKAVVNFLNLGPHETVTAVVTYGKTTENIFKHLVMATKNGIIKKTPVEDFASVRRSGLIAIKLKRDDILKWVKFSSGEDEVVLITSLGQAIRFNEKDIRPMGRNAAGVTGMRIKKGDELVGMDIVAKKREIAKKGYLLIITENGFGKRTALKAYRLQRRGGSGIKTAKITSKTGRIVSARIVSEEEKELIAISQKGQVLRTDFQNIKIAGRQTQGVTIMRLEKGDKVATITCL